MILWFIVGINVVLCVLLVLFAFRQGHKLRDKDIIKNYYEDTWSITNLFKVR